MNANAKRGLFGLLAVVLLVAFVVWIYNRYSGDSDTTRTATAVTCPAGYTCTPKGDDTAARTVTGGDEERSTPRTREDLLSAWAAGMERTPPPEGHTWRRITPRITSDPCSEIGAVRINPETGRLQGCGPPAR